MKRTSIILSCVIVFCMLFGVYSASAQYSMKMATFKGDGTPETTFNPGDDLLLDIKLNTPTTGVVAGCAFTLVYPSAMLTGPGTDTEGLPVVPAEISTDIFVFGAELSKTHRANKKAEGEILFSGATIDINNGGSGFHYQDETVFRLHFKVNQGVAGSATFELKQTALTNEAAGWNGEGVPVLVGAIGNAVTSCTGWAYPGTACIDGFGGDLKDDFPILLSDFSSVSDDDKKLTVNLGECDAYCQWKAAYPGLGIKTADDDHDGVTNEQEMYASSDPLSQNSPISEANIANVDVTDKSTWPTTNGYNAISDFRVSNLDVDGNGRSVLGEDGVLILRYMYDYRGPELITGAVDMDNSDGTICSRCTAEEIEDYINELDETVYDVDGSGIPVLGEDGVLIMRYMYDYRGEDLVRDINIPADATRQTAEDIEKYIQLLYPD